MFGIVALIWTQCTVVHPVPKTFKDFLSGIQFQEINFHSWLSENSGELKPCREYAWRNAFAIHFFTNWFHFQVLWKRNFGSFHRASSARLSTPAAYSKRLLLLLRASKVRRTATELVTTLNAVSLLHFTRATTQTRNSVFGEIRSAVLRTSEERPRLRRYFILSRCLPPQSLMRSSSRTCWTLIRVSCTARQSSSEPLGVECMTSSCYSRGRLARNKTGRQIVGIRLLSTQILVMLKE